MFCLPLKGLFGSITSMVEQQHGPYTCDTPFNDYVDYNLTIMLNSKKRATDDKARNLALIGASVFLACAVALGTWIRKL